MGGGGGGAERRGRDRKPNYVGERGEAETESLIL